MNRLRQAARGCNHTVTRLLLVLVTSAAALYSAPARSQTEIKFAHIGERGSLFDLSAQEFARRVNERLGSRAKLVVYGASQLGGDSDLLKKLKLGTVDLALPSTVMSTQVPVFGLFEMPYLVKDRDHMARIRDQIVLPLMAPVAEAEGYRILAVWENGLRHITNSKRPIVKPEDLKGLKLRVPQGEWRVKMFRAYGADPRPLAFSEVYVALQTGAMDGQENPFAQMFPARLHEVQKYLSLTGHVYTPAYVTAGRSWDRLASDVRRVLGEVAKDMQQVALRIAADLDAELLRKLQNAGMTVNEVDKSAFVKASDTIYREFSSMVPEGRALVDKALALGGPE
jgi:tripartite ATP-independent transporter DctP family solute receptor